MTKKLIDKNIPRFLVVGVLNTLVGTGVMFLLFSLTGWVYWTASTANYAVGGVLSYSLNKHPTFQNKEHGWAQVGRFALTVAMCWLTAYGVARPLVLWTLPRQSEETQEDVVLLADIVFYIGLDYFGQRPFASREKNSQGRNITPSEKEVFMKRFLLTLLALALAFTLGTPALTAGYRTGDAYIRILGGSGAWTVSVRTTYRAYRQTADDTVYRDGRYEFAHADDGVSWVSAGAAKSSLGSGMYDGTQFLAGLFGSKRPTQCSTDRGYWTAFTPGKQDTTPAIQRGWSSPNDLTFTLRGGRELWVMDRQGRAMGLTANLISPLASYSMADVQTYPVPQGIWVEAYSRCGYETGASHTYLAAGLEQYLTAAQPELLRITVEGKSVTLPISLYQVGGCMMAPLRQMIQALGYTLGYDGSSGATVRTRGMDITFVHTISIQATVNGKATNWLAVPVELRDGVLCVPVRFFAKTVGADVTRDVVGQILYLTTAIQEGQT